MGLVMRKVKTKNWRSDEVGLVIGKVKASEKDKKKTKQKTEKQEHKREIAGLGRV